MKYFKSSLLFIFLIVTFLFPVSINAAYDGISTTPSIIFEGSSVSYPIDLVDAEKEEGKIILYTKNYGKFTGPFGANTHEYVVVNDIIVQENSRGANGTYIPPEGYVISYTGKDEELIRKFAVGAGLTLSDMDIPVAPDMYFILEGLLVPIDQINTGRGANQVILYNAAYGASTKTNPWGMELTVIDGIITGIADMTTEENNSPIPPEGVVISIHSGSQYYKQVQEKAKQGGNIEVSADAKLYNASKIKYAAYNPRTIADNPAAWDREEGKPYDSFRGPEQLIIYDSSYGESTGTNPYGYEVAVNSEGKIISTGGNDSEIPEGGYILSGHGESLKWLQKYALLGSTVITDPDKKEVTVILTPDSYTIRALLSIESSQNRIDLARLQYLDISYDDVQKEIDLAAAKLANLNKQVEEGRYENLSNTVQEIQKAADKACFMTFESVKPENRAVWIRPRDTNANDVKKRFDMLESININTIYLETHWNGYTIYPTGNEIMKQNPMFNGFDVLASYLKEAHSRGIEVHAWVENFLVALPIAEKKPEWLNISRKGDNYYLENGVTKYYFMNPALPEVRDFLSELYKELVRKYNIDGIQFDYLRYPNSGDYTNDFGYDAYTRQLFMNFSGTDPITLKPGDSLWQKWCEFREYIISSYAYRIFSELKSLKPQVRISADIWPDYEDTLADIYQNPKAWVDKDYINTLIPMSYYLNEKPVAEDLVNSWAFSRGHSQVSSGIATFNKVDTKMLIKQIDAIRTSSTNGVAIFEYESLFGSGYADALKLGAFSTPSAVTDRDPEGSVKAILKDIVRKLDDIYLKNNGMDNDQRNKYKGLIEKIQVSLNRAGKKASYSLKNEIQEIMMTLNHDENLNEEISMRINADLNRAINIIDGYIADTRFMESHRVKEFQVELPLLRVKALFDDDTAMYLDRTQYTVHSGAETDGQAPITIDISDSFKFNTAEGVSKRIEFTIYKDGKDTIKSPAQRTLRASETDYARVELYWGSTITEPDMAGFVLYRNNEEILRTSSHSFRDDNLHPDETYTYEVHGFDTAGNIVYESDPVTVKTRAPLVAEDSAL